MSGGSRGGGEGVRALVLAAGRGTRLAPLTDRQPKPLVEVAGRPLVDYALAWLASHGVREVALNLHHLGEQVRQRVGDGAAWGLDVRYAVEEELLGTGGAIRNLAGFLGQGTFLVVNSDVVHDVDLGALLDRHRAAGALATLALRPDPDSARYGEIAIDAAGRIGAFLGRPPGGDEGLERLMFTGIHAVEPAVIERIPWPGASSITQDVYLPLVEQGATLCGVRYEGYWKDAGTPGRLDEVRRDLAEGRVALSYLP